MFGDQVPSQRPEPIDFLAGLVARRSSVMVKTTLALLVVLLAPAPMQRGWVPYKDRTHHRCGFGCSCGCHKIDQCSCDGRSCPVTIVVPDGDPVACLVPVACLPARAQECPNRRLDRGPTLYFEGGVWYCNDPRCYACNN
jgi:hypothetical protein